MRPRHTYILMVAVVILPLLSFANRAMAQQEPVVGLQPVEQTVADGGPLSTSLRWVEYGLREPYGFKQLYQLPIGEQNYVRRNAGLWAVFPRSLYITTRNGVSPSIPAGTVYYIGGPGEVIPRIVDNQEPYVQIGKIAPDRVEQSRIEAVLVDSRVPASSIESPGNIGVNARLFLEAGAHPPYESMPDAYDSSGPVDLATEDHQFHVRRQWEQATGTLSFIHDEAYRRECLRAAMSSGRMNDRIQSPRSTDDGGRPE